MLFTCTSNITPLTQIETGKATRIFRSDLGLSMRWNNTSKAIKNKKNKNIERVEFVIQVLN